MASFAVPALESRSSFDQVHLTYGVELEFMIAYSSAEITSEAVYRKREDVLAKQTLAQGKSYEDMNRQLAIIQNEIVREKVREVLKNFQIDLADDAQKSKKGPDEYNGWTVTGDSTVTASKSILDRADFQFLDGSRPQDERHFEEFRQQVEFVDMELISPAWNFIDFYVNSEEIRNVIRIIASRFKVFIPPKTAAFHVHVGNGDAGFSLQQTQNMALLFSTFERQFSQFHPKHRLNNVNCQLPRSLFRPADRGLPGMWDAILNLPRDIHELEVRRGRGNTVLHGDEARLKWLISRLGINRFKKDAETSQAYNVGWLMGFDGERARTVEFRQHRGTLHPRMINGWVLTVGAMVQVCCHASTTAFLDDLLELRAEGINFPVTDLFELLHLDDLVEDGFVAGHPVRPHAEDFGWKDFDYFQKFKTYDVARDNKYNGNNLSKYFGTDMGTWSVSSVGSALVESITPIDAERSPAFSDRSRSDLEQSPTDSEGSTETASRVPYRV